MDLRRLRGPLLAAIGTMLLAGGSVALANDPSSLPASTGTTAEEPENAGPDSDNVQNEVEDSSGADDATEADDAAEADAPDDDNIDDEAEDEGGADDAAEADAGAPDTDNVQNESGAAD